MRDIQNISKEVEALGFTESTSSNDLGINFVLIEHNYDDYNEIKVHLANSFNDDGENEEFDYHCITYGQDLLINYCLDNDELLSVLKSNRDLLVDLQLTNKKDLLIKLPKSSKGFGLSYDVSDDWSKPNIETEYFKSENQRNQYFDSLERVKYFKFNGGN